MLRLLKSSENLQSFFDLGRRGREGRMNHRNLSGMNTTHTFKSERAGTLGPAAQAVQVADIAKNGVDGLHSRGSRAVDQARPRIQRLAAFRGLGHAQVGGIVFEADGERDYILAG